MIANLSRMSVRFGINPVEAERFFKFMVVGAIGFVVDFGLFNLLIVPFTQLVAPGAPLFNMLTGLGLDPTFVVTLGPTFAGTVSFIAAIISNFMWNRYWTYPDSRSKSPRRQFVMFLLVSLVGIIIRVPIITFLHGPLTDIFSLFPILAPYAERLGSNAALAIAVVIVLFWNFFANRYWTYNDVD
ncbi:MAG: GtrA family protein [Candidatus Promineifilaceae bacterium]|nr:GtrA family protein [Candidatus Promineifilaceae bacterium]